MSDEQHIRSIALTFLFVLAPFLLLGAILTISLFGAIFGLPLLLVTVPPALLAWRVRTIPSNRERFGRFAFASAIVANLLTLALVATVVVGRDDLDTPLEWGALALAVAWVTAAWWVASQARTLSTNS